MYVFARKLRDDTNSSIDAGLIVFQVSVSFSQNKCHLLFFVSKEGLIKRKLFFISWVWIASFSNTSAKLCWIVFNWNMAKLRINVEQLEVTSISVSMYQFCSMAEFDLEFK